MFCPNCGTQLPDDSKFCAVCGESMDFDLEPTDGPLEEEILDFEPPVEPLGEETLDLDAAFEPKTPPEPQPVFASQAAPASQSGFTAQMPPVTSNMSQPQESQRRPGFIAGVAVMVIAAAVAVFAIGLGAFGHSQQPVTFSPVNIDSASFPDDNVRSIVSLTFDVDEDGVISLEEVGSVKVLELRDVKDFSGLERLPGFESLVVSDSSTPDLELPDNVNVETVTIKTDAASGLVTASFGNNPYIKQINMTGSGVQKVNASGCTVLQAFEDTDASLEEVQLPPSKDLTEVVVNENVVLPGIEETGMREFWLPASFSYEFERKGIETLTSNVTYNEEGLVTGLTYERFKGSDYSYEYDDAGRVIAMTDSGAYPSRTDIVYDGEGRVSSWSKSSVNGNSSLSYTYSDDGLMLECTGPLNGNDQHSYEVKYDKSGNAIAASSSTTSSQGDSDGISYTMEYDAAGQLISCDSSDRSQGAIAYAVTWDADHRISKISKDLNGVREGNEFKFDSNGRLEMVRSLSDFGLGASEFVYNDQGLPTSWRVLSNSDLSPIVSVSYKRFLTSNDEYEPQQIVLFGDLYPSINPSFWDPISIVYPSSDCIHRLPSMVPNLMQQ